MSSDHQPIPFINRIMAILLTVAFIGALILALFSLPIELVFLNPNQYLELLDQEEYGAILPEIASDLVINQMVPASIDNPLQSRIFQDAAIKSIIEESIPKDWLQSIFSSSLTQIFDFINFRTPYTAIEIDLGELKNYYLSNSSLLAERIYQSLPNCGREDLEVFSSSLSNLQLEAIPLCKPPDVFQNTYAQIIQVVIEDSVKQIPENVKISGIFPFDKELQGTLFNRYSLFRWGLRLLPMLAIALFISIAILLRQNRTQMLNWCGKTLIVVAVIMLVLLTVLLVGFDQFIAVMINRYISNVIPGFGNLLLKMAQDIGYQTLMWVIISAIVVLGFGILLQVSAKWYKPRIEETVSDPSLNETEIAKPNGEPSVSTPNNKNVIPDTMEEIEEKEKNANKSEN